MQVCRSHILTENVTHVGNEIKLNKKNEEEKGTTVAYTYFVYEFQNFHIQISETGSLKCKKCYVGGRSF